MKQVDLKNCLVRLTKTGLACLNTFEDGKPLNDEDMTAFYCSNDGVFRRYMSRDEFNSLCGLLPQLHVAVISDMICEMPGKWQFLWSWKVSDFTSYKPETCFNGGDYAFYETHFIFGRLHAGKLELIDVMRYTTSADFWFDEVNANFQNELKKVTFMDCEDADFCLYTQTSSREDEVWSLNQISNNVSVQEALSRDGYEIYGDKVEKDGQEYWAITPPTASTEVVESRKQILKDVLGWEPTKRR